MARTKLEALVASDFFFNGYKRKNQISRIAQFYVENSEFSERFDLARTAFNKASVLWWKLLTMDNIKKYSGAPSYSRSVYKTRPEFAELCDIYGLGISDIREAIFSNSFQRYLGYKNRNKRLPNYPIILKPNKALIFTGGMVALNTNGTLNLRPPLQYNWIKKTDAWIKHIPAVMVNGTPHVFDNLAMGAVIKPYRDGHLVTLRGYLPFTTAYVSTDFIGVDVNDSPDTFLAFSDGDFLVAGNNFRKLIQNRKSLDDKIKTASTSSERSKHRRAWVKSCNKLDAAAYPYAQYIFEKARQNNAYLGLDTLAIAGDLSDGWDVILPRIISLCENNGIAYVKVPTPYSSQRCHNCGVVDPINRMGGPKEYDFYKCTCGVELHADTNAALNIAAYAKHFYLYNAILF